MIHTLDWIFNNFWEFTFPLLITILFITTEWNMTGVNRWRRWFTRVWLSLMVVLMIWIMWSGYPPMRPNPPKGPALVCDCHYETPQIGR